MYTITINRHFAAAHSITINDTPEPLHGHNFHVTLSLQGPALDPEGLLLDFHQAEAVLDEVLATLHNTNLNQTPPFDRTNPTAENLAKHIADRFGELADTPNASLASVTITESPGCAVTYTPPAYTPPRQQADTP